MPETFPGNFFNWYFLDDHINRHYQQQRVVRNQISFFTFLTIGVACLGLLGMIANKVADKTKEIGIRRRHPQVSYCYPAFPKDIYLIPHFRQVKYFD